MSLGGLAGAVYQMGQQAYQKHLVDLQDKRAMAERSMDLLSGLVHDPSIESESRQHALQALSELQTTPLDKFDPKKVQKTFQDITGNYAGRELQRVTSASQAPQPNTQFQAQPMPMPPVGNGGVQVPAGMPAPPQLSAPIQAPPEMPASLPGIAPPGPDVPGALRPFMDPSRAAEAQAQLQTILNGPKFAEYKAQAEAMQNAEMKRMQGTAEFNKKLERDKLDQTRQYLQSNVDPTTGKTLYDSLDPFVKAELETGKNLRPETKAKAPMEFGTTEMLRVRGANGQESVMPAFLDKTSGLYLDLSHNPIDPKTIISTKATSDVPKNDFEAFWLPNFAKGLGKTVAELTSAENTRAFREYKQDPDAKAAAESSRNLSDALKRMQIDQQPTPEQAKQVASDVVAHRIAPEQLASMFGGFGASGQNFKRMVYGEAKKLDPNFDFEQSSAEYGLVKSPQFQNTIRYMDSVRNSIPLVIKRAQELGNSKVRFVNGLANMGRDQLNDPKLRRFQTDALLVADEIAKILQGGGTGNGTSDKKLDQAAQIIKSSDSPEALAAGLEDVQQLMKYRRKSLTEGTYMAEPLSTSPMPNPPAGGAKRKVWNPQSQRFEEK